MKNINLLLATSALAVGSSGAFAGSHTGSITAVSWGGAYTVSQVEAYHKPWTAATGNTVVSEDYSGGIAEVKAQVEAGNVTWDIIDVEKSDAVRGCDEGLFMEIDPTSLPAGSDGTAAVDDFIPGSFTDCAVANIVWSTIFAYDSSVTPNGPKTIADFFNVNAFPGKRGLRKSPKANLEMALAADGVASADIYDVLATDEGVDRAFAKLDTIKDMVVWWEAGAQPPQLLADGEVAMTTAYNGRIFNAVAGEGKSFEIVWDAQVLDVDMWAIIKGAPNAELAMDFLKFSTATEQLAAQASYIAYGPARKSSAPYVTTYHSNADLEMGPQMPTAAANLVTAIPNDFEFWADNADELNERFNAWLIN
jgi:putative spermidine/putrescine transport system substrate-binding protein